MCDFLTREMLMYEHLFGVIPTHREIFSNQTEIRLCLPFSDWFGIKQAFFWFQINRKLVITIWLRFILPRLRRDLSEYEIPTSWGLRFCWEKKMHCFKKSCVKLSDRLASLGILRARLRTTLKPSVITAQWYAGA